MASPGNTASVGTVAPASRWFSGTGHVVAEATHDTSCRVILRSERSGEIRFLADRDATVICRQAEGKLQAFFVNRSDLETPVTLNAPALSPNR
jgi:hypothetical protein